MRATRWGWGVAMGVDSRTSSGLAEEAVCWHKSMNWPHLTLHGCGGSHSCPLTACERWHQEGLFPNSNFHKLRCSLWASTAVHPRDS